MKSLLQESILQNIYYNHLLSMINYHLPNLLVLYCDVMETSLLVIKIPMHHNIGQVSLIMIRHE